ncbi:MAG TPA: hypothetical protein VEL76_27945 [Gemmataceae bacterium]|nr:hypothetical protein [Gemmataceae bacterium]
MNFGEFSFTLLLIVLLLALAGYFGLRQLRALRRLRARPDLPREDRRFVRRQALRRLICCCLMILVAGMLIGWFFLHPHYLEVSRQLDERPQGVEATPEQTAFLRFFAAYWIIALFAVFLVVFLATVDFWAIARFGLRHHRRLQADQRALLEEQIARLRARRNGEGSG